MRVDDPNDIEFIDAEALQTELDNFNFICIIKRAERDLHYIVFSTLSEITILPESFICFETQDKRMVKAKVKKVSQIFTDFWGNQQSSTFMFKVTFYEDSDKDLLDSL
jgi:predicted lactoylglutathione lyase